MKIATSVMTLGLGLLLLGSVASAQAQQPSADAQKVLDTQINMLRKDLRDQKKQIVAANMTLTGDEAAKFWPLYDAYTIETIKINDRRVALVKEYAVAYNSMTDALASKFIRGSSSIDEAATKLRMDWVPKFEQSIGGKKAAIFFQIDRRIGLMLDLQLAAELPLVQP